MQGDDRFEEMICSRILFLLTYNATFDFNKLFDEHSLAESINQVSRKPSPHPAKPHVKQNIAFHAAKYSGQNLREDEVERNEPIYCIRTTDSRALSESLKLLFNLNHFYSHRITSFSQTLPHVLTILHKTHLEHDPLQPPVNYLINAILNFELPGGVDLAPNDSKPIAPLFPPSDATLHTRRLIDILDLSLRANTEEKLEKTAVPLLTLIRRLNEVAPSDVREYMRKELLPSDAERDQPLGSSDSLASRLLKVSTTPVAPQLKEGLSSLLFELSDKDAGTYIRNVGYGYAAGYLMSHKIAFPEDSLKEDVGAKMTTVGGEDINPVTGQKRAMEPPDPSLDMTDEEKEREAERLFVLFERLKATGVMNVANPIEQAAREGRFEEVHEE